MINSSDESKQMTIEVYSADCPICEDTVDEKRLRPADARSPNDLGKMDRSRSAIARAAHTLCRRSQWMAKSSSAMVPIPSS